MCVERVPDETHCLSPITERLLVGAGSLDRLSGIHLLDGGQQRTIDEDVAVLGETGRAAADLDLVGLFQAL